MVEVKPYKYEQGDFVICNNLSLKNDEDLILGRTYEVIGISMHDGNIVYVVRDVVSKLIRYSMDRFVKVDDVDFETFWDEMAKEDEVEKKVEEPKNDPVSPNHYKLSEKFETLDVIEASTKKLIGIQATDTGNVIKYITRFSDKNGLEDLKKARYYLNHLIENVEKNGIKKA